MVPGTSSPAPRGQNETARNQNETPRGQLEDSLGQDETALGRSERIELRGFGIFNVRPRKTGIGRNPRTGAEVAIPPGKAVRFKPGKELQTLQ